MKLINFKGDPKQQVMQRQSILQDKFNVAVQQTNQFYSMLRKR